MGQLMNFLGGKQWRESNRRSRTQIVCSYDDAVLELDGEHRRARHGGRLRVRNGSRVVEVGAVVGAVHIVSGLVESQ